MNLQPAEMDATYQLVPDAWELTLRVGATVQLATASHTWPSLPAGTQGRIAAMEVQGRYVTEERPIMVIFTVGATLAELYPLMFKSAPMQRMGGTRIDPNERIERLTMHVAAADLILVQNGEGATFAELAESYLTELGGHHA